VLELSLEGAPRCGRQRRPSLQTGGNALGWSAKKTVTSAESAIHRKDEAGRWPATNSNRPPTQGVAAGLE